MPAEQFANNAQTTLNGAINNSTTSVVVNSVTGFPTTGQFRILIDSEILLVTSVNAGTNTFTVQLRGLSGTPDATSPAAHTNGATITQVLTAGAILNLPPFAQSGPGHAVGYVPDPGSTTGTTRFLREDGTWVSPAVVPTGTILAYGGYSAPSGYLLCDGSPYLQSTYPALFSALSLSITGTVINGTNTITSVSPTASSDSIGATVIGNGIPNGTTITAIVTGPALQLSNNATATATGESLTLVPYGTADSTHFYVPDLRGRVPVGADPSQVNTPHLWGSHLKTSYTLGYRVVRMYTHWCQTRCQHTTIRSTIRDTLIPCHLHVPLWGVVRPVGPPLALPTISVPSRPLPAIPLQASRSITLVAAALTTTCSRGRE